MEERPRVRLEPAQIERARRMAEALTAAAGKAEAFARRWLDEAASGDGDLAREALGRAALCRQKAHLWRLAAAQLTEAAEARAAEARQEEDRS